MGVIDRIYGVRPEGTARLCSWEGAWDVLLPYPVGNTPLRERRKFEKLSTLYGKGWTAADEALELGIIGPRLGAGCQHFTTRERRQYLL